MSDSELRILALVPTARRPGQVARFSVLDEELRALGARGVSVYVIATSSGYASDVGNVHVREMPASLWDWSKAALFLIRHLGFVVRLAGWRELLDAFRQVRIERFAAELVRRERLALIHSFFAWPGGFGGVLAKRDTGVPLVAGLRGADVNTMPERNYGGRRNRLFDAAMRAMLGQADATVSVSDFIRRRAIALGADPAAARVILKGVHLEMFRIPSDKSADRAALQVGADPLILAVAGLVPIKGLRDVLDALARVRAGGRRFSFVVCGEGGEKTALEQHAAQLGLADCVVLAGKVSRAEIGTYFRAADLFVHGALIEASGNVLLEAMASGLPIVCTDAGGPAEYVLDGECGFVVPVGDSAAMADRIITLLDDEAMRRRFGQEGRRRAEEFLSYDRMIDEVIDLYTAVAARG